MDRILSLHSHIYQNTTAGKKGDYTLPRSLNKLDWFKNQGWGYKDTQFVLEDDGNVLLTGTKYEFAGIRMPKFKEWAERVAGLDVSVKTPAQEHIACDAPNLNLDFMSGAEGKFNEISIDDAQRIHHSHGHSLQEMFALRYGRLDRVVDCVIFVSSHEQAETLVGLAMKHNVVLVPYGGGTNVTQALLLNSSEPRMVVSVDMTRMNHVKWVDRQNMTACVEAGILGQDLEKELARYGVVCGHEPDSVEFSSLGGWLSTRASGMKKNRYGNIEDIALQMKIVTPVGTLSRTQDQPRVSSGPDLNEIILGSEGTLGIITEAVIKVRNQPKKIVYDSVIFYNFTQGIEFMYDVAQSRIWPASLRLVDNKQFQFGMALKPAAADRFNEIKDKAKKFFLTQMLNYDPEQMCLVTALYEGSEEEVAYQQKSINKLAKKHKGFRAGAESGQRAYFLTYMIAYIRDYGFQFSFFAESFETSCSWKNVPILCQNVQQRMVDDCRKLGVTKTPFISFRVTQVYDTGAAVYIYFGFQYQGMSEPLKIYGLIEDGAREEIMKCGGSISHHHGVGKLRKQFMEQSVGTVGKKLLSQIKLDFDPKNIFASGNLGI